MIRDINVGIVLAVVLLVGVGVLVNAGLLDASIQDTIVGIILGGAGTAALVRKGGPG